MRTAIELPNRDDGFDLGDRANPWDFIFEANEQEKAIAEGRIDEYLRSRGETVEVNPLEGQAGAGRQPDRYVNGQRTEYKTLSPGAVPKTIMNRVNDSARGTGQAENVIVDVRQTDLTEQQVEEGLNLVERSAYLRAKIRNVRVIGEGFDILRSIPR